MRRPVPQRAHVKWLNQNALLRCKGGTGMKKVSTGMTTAAARDFIGLDLSDKTATYVVLSAAGEVIQDGKIKLSQAGLEKVLGARPPAEIAIEVGAHSPWLS